MRKSTGLVKLVAGHIESRKVDVEAAWEGADQEVDGQDDEDDDDEAGSEENDDEDDEDEEDEEPVPAPIGKRKRPEKTSAPPARPSKKVSFAADPKESKKARSAAGAAKKITPVTSKAKPVSSKLKPSKVANASAGKASQKSTMPSKAGEEAYDFGKFF
jgi:nuclear GTP-binding protein